MGLFTKGKKESELSDAECAALRAWVDDIGQRMPVTGELTNGILAAAGPMPLAPRSGGANGDIAHYTARYYSAEIAARYSRQEWIASDIPDSASSQAHVLRAQYWESLSVHLKG
ncbi:MAG TPA: hypothetical protein VGF84_19075 [Micromonosporaceae bacterium]|jgi:hypothetical protein